MRSTIAREMVSRAPCRRAAARRSFDLLELLEHAATSRAAILGPWSLTAMRSRTASTARASTVTTAPVGEN
jgi:hypothetical protein